MLPRSPYAHLQNTWSTNKVWRRCSTSRPSKPAQSPSLAPQTSSPPTSASMSRLSKISHLHLYHRALLRLRHRLHLRLRRHLLSLRRAPPPRPPSSATTVPLPPLRTAAPRRARPVTSPSRRATQLPLMEGVCAMRRLARRGAAYSCHHRGSSGGGAGSGQCSSRFMFAYS